MRYCTVSFKTQPLTGHKSCVVEPTVRTSHTASSIMSCKVAYVNITLLLRRVIVVLVGGFVKQDSLTERTKSLRRASKYTGYTQKNGVVLKVNKKFISHLTRAQRTPSAVATGAL
jgi:hypothetical protein